MRCPRWVVPVAAVVLGGCAPETRFRRTALVPQARMLPWDGRTAPAGSLRIEGALSGSSVVENWTPVVGDTALHVPATTVDGAAAIAATGGFEVGGRYSYGIYSQSNITATGTPPIPSMSPTTGFGPELRGTVRFGDSGDFALGFAGNMLFYSVPTASWVLDSTCVSGPNCFDSTFDTSSLGPVRYRLEHEGSVSQTVLNFGILASYQFGGGKFGHIFGGVGAHSGFENRGFSDNADGPAVEKGPIVTLFGGGYGIKVDVFRAAISVSHAATGSNSPVNYGLGGFLTVGVDLPLWTPAPPQERVQPPPPPPGYYWQPPPGPPPAYYGPQPPPPGPTPGPPPSSPQPQQAPAAPAPESPPPPAPP